MDGGYDSDKIHHLIKEDLIADSIIPIRSRNNNPVGEMYRKEMIHKADDPKYRRRQLVETTFSALKRKFRGDLKARKFPVQRKDIVNKLIISNTPGFLLFLISVVFRRVIFVILFLCFNI